MGTGLCGSHLCTLVPYCVCSWRVSQWWARGHEAECEGLFRGIVRRRGVAQASRRGDSVGVWTEPPFSWGTSPSPTPHLWTVAAGLAGRQVLAEPMAQVRGAEPGTGRGTGPELKGRCAAVLWGQQRLVGGRPETPSTPSPEHTGHDPLKAPWGRPVRVQTCPQAALRTG